MTTPSGVERVDVRSAREMRDAVLASVGTQDVFISAAAVGDFRPQTMAAQMFRPSVLALFSSQPSSRGHRVEVRIVEFFARRLGQPVGR